MQQYKKINNIVGWVLFLFATIVYALTLESSGSFWDCGEFVPGCFKLQVAHAPGAPFFLMLGRIFTLFAFGDVTKVAWMVNFMSGLTTAASIMFCYWSTTLLIGRFVFRNKETDYNTGNIIAVVGSGIIAAACATFLDSAWFSAVEGEVYALSQFFLTIIVWAILKWESIDERTDKYADRWLLFIAYMVGLSIGVHLLSLLALPFIALVYYYKRWKQPSFLGFFAATAAGFLILGFAMKFVISYTQMFMAGFDHILVNSMGLPFYSGVVLFFLLLISALTFGIAFTQQRNYRTFNTFVLAATFVYIGYLSYAMVPIRASANTPINMGRPTDPYSIKAYVDREQYGDRPLLYGPDYTAGSGDIKEVVELGDKYYKGKDKYEFAGKKIDYKFKDEVCMPFPRLGFWQEEGKKAGYRAWLNPGAKLIDRRSDEVVQEFDPGQGDMANQIAQQRNINDPGRFIVKDKITFADNIWFFLKYQVGYMYFRYFMWNFAGRQNDIQGTYGNDDGRWISGIPFIDNSGKFFTPEMPQTNLSKTMLENKGHNKFYMIPLILGLIGMVFTLYKDEKTFLIILVLFGVTGLLQIVYQNEPPIEPRERDYAQAGSFWTYCIWIGFGVFAIIQFLWSKIQNSRVPVAVGVILLACSAPFLMGSQGWDDHNRHGRYTARDFAVDYLESCQPNAILFTQGDNDTYPLWYAQEVEGIRPDVRVINLSLLGVDWYIQQLKYRWNKSAPVKITFTDDQVQASNRDVIRYNPAPNMPENAPRELKKVLQFIASEDPSAKTPSGNGETENYLPTKTVYIDIDSEKATTMNFVDPRDNAMITPRMQWQLGGTLLKNDLIALDIVANNLMDRPIYYAVSVAPDAYVGMEKFFQLEGMTYRIVPINSDARNAQSAPVRCDASFKNMMEKFRFGGIKENPNIYLDENIMRMTMNLRGNYARLAQALLQKGEKDKAIAALDHVIAEMPGSRVPYNIFMVSFPEIYYAAGEKQKAQKLTDELWAKAKDELRYYQAVYNRALEQARDAGDRTTLQQLQQGSFVQQRPLQEQLYTLQELVQTAKRYDLPERSDALEKDFKATQMSFVKMPAGS
ncbi:MAG: DUF2723 domain-containing protein [Chitinophagales bacterium]